MTARDNLLKFVGTLVQETGDAPRPCEKRPADVIGNAIMIARIATGEIEDITTETARTPQPWRWAAWVVKRGRLA